MVNLLFLIFAITLFIMHASGKPDIFHIARTKTMRASPGTIFARINSMNAWRAWSPYERLDMRAQRSVTGPESGPGSKYTWSGNRRAGAGNCTITESTPPSQVVMRLEMTKPFQAEHTVTFTLTPRGDSTDVTWEMSGRQSLMMKVMGTIMNCEKMAGNQFNEGLENLKSLVEK